jgi:hypothetical protein
VDIPISIFAILEDWGLKRNLFEQFLYPNIIAVYNGLYMLFYNSHIYGIKITIVAFNGKNLKN